MANATRGEHAVTCLDGQVYTLVFDANAYCDLEDRTGVGIADLEQVMAKPTAKLLRTLFAVGLLARHPDITEREAGALLGVKAMGEAVGAAIAKSLPEASGEARPPLAPAGGTG